MSENNRPDPENSPLNAENDFKNDPNLARDQPNRTQVAPESIANNMTKNDPTSTPGWERNTLEKLAFASLSEQKATRRWKTFVRLAWLTFFVVVVWLVMHRGTAVTSASVAHTAVIEIKGEIADGADASAEFINAALKAAFEDDSAKAVVLLINSPGGSPVQAGMMNDEIRRLKAKHKKPVYAVVGETCASAAYYIAVAADQIFVDKASIVGSIGVLMDGFGFTGLMEKLGVERRLLTSGENKGFLDPFSAQTEKQRAYAQAMLNQIHQQFIGIVKEGRGQRLKESPEMFSGLFWTGQQAVELGLADKIGSLEYVAREIVKTEEIIDYTRRDNVAERLAKKFGAAVGAGAIKAVRELPAIR